MKPVEAAIARVAEQWPAGAGLPEAGGGLGRNVPAARYANPAAYHIGNASAAVARFVIAGGDDARTRALGELDDVAKIAALSREPLSASLRPFFALRDIAMAATHEAGCPIDGETVESRVGECLLYVADGYAQAREKVAQISIAELRREIAMLESMQAGRIARHGEAEA